MIRVLSILTLLGACEEITGSETLICKHSLRSLRRVGSRLDAFVCSAENSISSHALSTAQAHAHRPGSVGCITELDCAGRKISIQTPVGNEHTWYLAKRAVFRVRGRKVSCKEAPIGLRARVLLTKPGEDGLVKSVQILGACK